MSKIRIELAREEDIPRLMEIVMGAFGDAEYSRLVGHTNTPENRLAAGDRHLRAWREHAAQFSQPFWIKCVHTDPSTGLESIIASAEWLIYDRPRTVAEYTQPSYIASAAWVSDTAKRKAARRIFQPMLDKRIAWLAGKPYGLLIYMATDPAFRRQGAATACVQWGLDRCDELDIPAYLEASKTGAPVYERLGYEICETVQKGFDESIIMIRWPEGLSADERKPVLPGYKKESLP